MEDFFSGVKGQLEAVGQVCVCVCENICPVLIMLYQAVVASSYLAVARVAECCSRAELVLIRRQIHSARKQTSTLSNLVSMTRQFSNITANQIISQALSWGLHGGKKVCMCVSV